MKELSSPQEVFFKVGKRSVVYVTLSAYVTLSL